MFVGVVVEYPITVHVDNVGAVFLPDNTSVPQRKNHIDVNHHFIKDYVDDGTVKIIFLRKKKTYKSIYKEPK